jgi:WD40 repeat protein
VVRVWTDLRGLRRLDGHDGMVTAVALGPGGRRALTGDDAPVVLSWDLELGGRPARSDGHEGIVTAVAIAADGRLGASASSDGVVRLWDLDDGTELDKAALGPGWITALAVCTLGVPEGGDGEEVFVLAGRADGRLLLHDFAAGDGGTVGDGHEGGVTAVVVTPDGRLAASCGADHTIAVHDLRAGTPATGFTADFPFLACAFAPTVGGGAGLLAVDASGVVHRLALVGFPAGRGADRPDGEVRAPAR